MWFSLISHEIHLNYLFLNYFITKTSSKLFKVVNEKIKINSREFPRIPANSRSKTLTSLTEKEFPRIPLTQQKGIPGNSREFTQKKSLRSNSRECNWGNSREKMCSREFARDSIGIPDSNSREIPRNPGISREFPGFPGVWQNLRHPCR